MAEGERQEEATKGGYEKHWFTKKEKALQYRCGMCNCIFKDPQQIVCCGHQFCLSCLPVEVKKCPTCDKDVRANEVFPDESARQKVLALQMKCPTKLCLWKGSLQVFEEEHKNACPFHLLKCRNEACNEMIARDEFEKHLQDECEHRKIDCHHCGTNITFAEERTHCDNDCLRIPVACPQQCLNEVPRNEVQNHVDNECEKTLIDCTFKAVGCETKVERGKLREHEEATVQEHLSQAILVIDKMSQENAEITKQLHDVNNNLTQEVRDLNEREEIDVNKIDSELKEFKEQGTIRLEGAQKATEQNFETLNKIVEQNGELQEALLYFHNELSTLLNITIPQLQASCFARQTENHKLADYQVQLRKMTAGVYNKLMNALASQRKEIDSSIDTLYKTHEEEHKERVEHEAETGEEISKVTRDIAENRSELEKQKTALVTTKDEMDEKFREHAKQMQVDYDCLSHDVTEEKHSRENEMKQLREEISDLPLFNSGILVWRVNNVEAALTQARANSKNAVHGKAFSSEPYGYVLQPKIFFNGARKKDQGFLSIFIQILKGKYDPILKWPFGKHIRVTLIEQDNKGYKRDLQKDLIPVADADELRRPTEDANNGFGIYKFVSHEVLRAGRYIVDGAIFVKIEVLGDFERNVHSETV